MKIDELIAMGDMMRACLTFKRYVDDAIAISCSHDVMLISTLRAQELQNAADMLRQALSVLEPNIQVLLLQAQSIEASSSLEGNGGVSFRLTGRPS